MENGQFLSVMGELLDRCGSLCYITDPKTDEIVFISPRTRDHFEIDLASAGDKCWRWIQKSGDAPCVFCAKDRLSGDPGAVVASDQYDPMTGRCYKRRDSVLRWFDGGYLHLHILDDVTDSFGVGKCETGESEQDDALERERQSRQNFLENMSRELRSQLNSVTGMASLAREGSDLNKIRYAMERIELVVSNMLALLDDILYMSGLESLDDADEYQTTGTMPLEEEMQQSLRDARKKSAEILRAIPGCRILFAEDDEIHREIVLMYLEDTGIQIDVARTGAEAVAMFERRAGGYSLILMDDHMPEMDGYEATRRIRALPLERAKSVPILAMSANALPEDEERSLALGMNGHITKPVDWTDLLSILVYHLKPK